MTLSLKGIEPDQLRALTPEELLASLDPLLSRSARTKFVPGYDEEDLKQEYSIVALRCHRSWRPEAKAGYAGKRASFMHFVMTAINNQTIKLADKGSRQTREVRRLACMGCGFEKGIWQKGCCDRCGGEKWRPLWAGAAASLNELFDGPDSDEAPRRGEPGVPDDTDTVAQTDLLIAVLKAIRPEDRAEFMAAMETGKLRTELREQLQIRLAALYSRVYSRRTTSKIVA